VGRAVIALLAIFALLFVIRLALMQRGGRR
jgi:hypothetical protein